MTAQSGLSSVVPIRAADEMVVTLRVHHSITCLSWGNLSLLQEEP
jgi:hypothetical protein